MSNSPSRQSTKKSDRAAAVTLEVPTGVADDIEAILRKYAVEAELDTSLVVDHSGFLIAGISSIPDVDVDTIGALVAGAGGATEGLTGALGEEGRVESLHLGEDRLLYLKEVGERYILVGVSDSNVPAGILRDQANLIEDELLKQLTRVKAVPMSLTKKKAQPKPEPEKKPEPPKSLRQPEPKQPEPARPQVRAAAPKPNAGEKIVGTIGAQPSRSIEGTVPVAKPAQPAQPARPQRPAQPAAVKKDPIPESAFEVEVEEKPAKPVRPGKVAEEKKAPKPAAAKRVEPHAIVENSPFEMDDDDDDDPNFKPVRPNTTPVHLSVPAARQREAAARKENEDDDDQQSGPRYSFELG